MTGVVLPSGGEIERHARLYLATLSAPEVSTEQPGVGKSDVTRSEIGEALSDLILGPVASHLSHQRVLIVADGILHFLPFAALPAPRPLPSSEERPALVVDHEIVHLPSASTIALLRGAWTRERQWPKPLMVFADPVFEADDPRIAGGARGTQSGPRPAFRTRRSHSLARYGTWGGAVRAAFHGSLRRGGKRAASRRWCLMPTSRSISRPAARPP